MPSTLYININNNFTKSYLIYYILYPFYVHSSIILAFHCTKHCIKALYNLIKLFSSGAVHQCTSA